LLVVSGNTTTIYTVSGTIKDVDQFPVAGAVITDMNGAMAVTDVNGNYTLHVQSGDNRITATKSGYIIAPKQVTVLTNLSNVNFIAEVGCGNIVVNPAVTTGEGGWDFHTSDTDVIAGTDTTIFNSAPSSGRTGIDPAAAINVPSITWARSQVYHIPDDPDFGADTAFLGIYLYQVSTSAVGEGDHQYVDILDEDNNLLRTVLFENLNTAAWTYHEFLLDDFIGKDIKVQVRTLNDGTGGVSAMYFDDVNLTICNLHCSEQVLNGGFELPSTDPNSGWYMYTSTVVSPTYTTALAHRGLWSMQTGIPLGGANVEDSFSEVFQYDINLPSSHQAALLSFWLYNTSARTVVTVTNQTTGAPLPQLKSVPAVPYRSGPRIADQTNIPANDTFYVYIMDNNDEPLEGPLVWKTATNTNEWQRYQFDVSRFLGQDIELLFGIYNDGLGKVSAMYIDDVSLGTCP
jgi:hypothetical protein